MKRPSRGLRGGPALLAQAAQTDKAEDRQLGASKRGDEMPEWMPTRRTAREDPYRRPAGS